LSPQRRHGRDEGVVSESRYEYLLRTQGPQRTRAFVVEHGLEDRFDGRWAWHARPEQLQPPAFQAGTKPTWLLLCGRGFGKSRVLSETALDWIVSGECKRIALVAPTASAARDVNVDGESGILACAKRRGLVCEYQPSLRRVVFPTFGAVITLYSAEEPDRLRGPQHDGAVVDELAAFADPQATWDQLQFTMRLGRPRTVIASTPRPIPLIRRLVADPTVHTTRGSTYDNSKNLAPSFLEAIRRTHENTRLGRQEIYAEILDDHPGAMFKRADLDATRVAKAPDSLKRVVTAIDPALTAHGGSDLTGIVSCGIAPCPCKGTRETHCFVLADDSGVYTPDAWARRAVSAYERHGADRLVAEVNAGGDLVLANIRTVAPHLPVTKIHASRGKQLRAEPVAAIVEQHKLHIVGSLGRLEDELVTWDPTRDSKSPDRLDAMVYAVSHLMLRPAHVPYEAPGKAYEPPTNVDPWYHARPDESPPPATSSRDPRRPGGRW
jgi:phage terminase large subunit-like protein